MAQQRVTSSRLHKDYVHHPAELQAKRETSDQLHAHRHESPRLLDSSYITPAINSVTRSSRSSDTIDSASFNSFMLHDSVQALRASHVLREEQEEDERIWREEEETIHRIKKAQRQRKAKYERDQKLLSTQILQQLSTDRQLRPHRSSSRASSGRLSSISEPVIQPSASSPTAPAYDDNLPVSPPFDKEWAPSSSSRPGSLRQPLCNKIRGFATRLWSKVNPERSRPSIDSSSSNHPNPSGSQLDPAATTAHSAHQNVWLDVIGAPPSSVY